MADRVEPLSFSDENEPAFPADEFIVPDHKASEPKRTGIFQGKAQAIRERSKETVKESIENTFTKEVPNRKGQFVKPMTELYTMMGLVITPFNQPVGMATAGAAVSCAEAWDELAQQNPAVRRALKGLLTTNAAVAVAAAHLPILLAIAMQVPAVRTLIAGKFGGFDVDNIDAHMEEWRKEQRENGDLYGDE